MLREFSFYEVIDKIRVRPGMFIGNSSPNSLQVFLQGYKMAMLETGVVDASHPPLRGFHDWVASRLGFSSSVPGWANMILATTMGLDPAHVSWEEIDRSATRQQQIEATTRVFELLDEYRREAPTR
jgi:hypothetical protein